MSDVRVIEGDSLAILPTLESGSVDAVITDPPYSSGGMFRGDRARPGKDKCVGGGYANGAPPVDRPGFGGDSMDQRAWQSWCLQWMTTAYRAARDGGFLCCFIDWRQLPALTDVLQWSGWIWRGIAVWDKTEAARPQLGWFRNQCEYVVWGSKGTIGGGEALPGVWRQGVGQNAKLHVAGKPVEVMRGIVRICPPGGLVLDPFAGSGTTGIAALAEGRRAVLIEREPAYVEVIRRRLADARGESGLFAPAMLAEAAT